MKALPRSGLLSPRSLVRKFMPAGHSGLIGTGWIKSHRNKSYGHRHFGNDVASLGRIGSLEVRLARGAREVKKAQELRYHVFYEEMSAIADAETQAQKRDFDAFDAICDHMLVVDHDLIERGKPFQRKKPQVVGTYRLLRQDIANRFGGFYSSGEFDIQPLLEARPDLRFLELGRSCVLKPYRNKRTVELLWHGIWSYVLMNGIDVMIGCASIEGTDADRLASQLSFLHHYARAPEDWRVRAVDDRYVE